MAWSERFGLNSCAGLRAPQPKSQLDSGKDLVAVEIALVKKVHFGSSGSRVATFQYSSGSKVSTFHTLAAPARKSQLFNTSRVRKLHFGSSGSKVVTFQYKCRKEIHSATHFLA